MIGHEARKAGKRSAAIEGALRARLATADRIMRLAALCRRAESEAERVAPFGALAALTPCLPTQTLALTSPRELAERLAGMGLQHQTAARIAAAEAHLPPQLATCIVQELTEDAAGVPKPAHLPLPEQEPAGWADGGLIQVHYPSHGNAGDAPGEAMTAAGAPEQAGCTAANAAVGVDNGNAWELIGAQDLAATAELQEAPLARTGFSMDSDMSAGGAAFFTDDQEAAAGFFSPAADALAAEGDSPLQLYAPGSGKAEAPEQDADRAAVHDSSPAAAAAAGSAAGALPSEAAHAHCGEAEAPLASEASQVQSDAASKPRTSTALQSFVGAPALLAGRSHAPGSESLDAVQGSCVLALPAASGGGAAEQGSGWCHALDARGLPVPRERLLDNAFRRYNKARAGGRCDKCMPMDTHTARAAAQQGACSAAARAAFFSLKGALWACNHKSFVLMQ